MAQSKATNKWWLHHIFHEQLEEFIKENYNLEIKWSKIIAWGYQTTAVYLETQDNKKYLLKLTKELTARRLRKLQKDITMANFLKETLPTASYIKSNSGKYITKHQEYYIRVSHLVEGVAPFNIDIKTFKLLIDVLKSIHSKTPKDLDIPIYQNKENKKYRLLHGDLTPSNILISYSKLVLVMDFEFAMVGPIEWDLSRTTSLSWFRVEDMPFTQLTSIALEHYAKGSNFDFDGSLYIKLALKHIEGHLKNVKNNQSGYENEIDYKNDLEFTTKKLDQLKVEAKDFKI